MVRESGLSCSELSERRRIDATQRTAGQFGSRKYQLVVLPAELEKIYRCDSVCQVWTPVPGFPVMGAFVQSHSLLARFVLVRAAKAFRAPLTKSISSRKSTNRIRTLFLRSSHYVPRYPTIFRRKILRRRLGRSRGRCVLFQNHSFEEPDRSIGQGTAKKRLDTFLGSHNTRGLALSARQVYESGVQVPYI